MRECMCVCVCVYVCMCVCICVICVCVCICKAIDASTVYVSSLLECNDDYEMMKDLLT